MQYSAYLSALALVLAVLGEEAAEEVSAAAGYMDQRALLPQAETRRHRQHQSDRLDEQRPFPQVATDDEAAQDGFDLQKNLKKALKGTSIVPIWTQCVERQWFSPLGFLSHRRTAQTLAPVTPPGRRTAGPTGCTRSSSTHMPPLPER